MDSLLDRFTIFPCAHALAMIRHDDFDQWLYSVVVVVRRLRRLSESVANCAVDLAYFGLLRGLPSNNVLYSE